MGLDTKTLSAHRVGMGLQMAVEVVSVPEL
jgi:hypothetical protein